MDLNLTDKIAIVAGGSRGSGLAIATELAAEGAAVVLTGRNPGLVEDAVARIAAAGGRVRGLTSDMVSVEDAERIVDLTRTAFGEPDILVVNPPSPSHRAGFETIMNEDYLEAHEMFTMSLVNLAREVLPAMKARQWGRIVALASIVKTPHLDVPMAHQNTRVGSVAIVKTISFEFAKYNLTANSIAPGAIASALATEYLDRHGYDADAFIKTTPMQRFGQGEDIAALVAFLCSDRAGFISGEVIRIDGGASHSLF
jgi:3-oxoacyl-[acyl-carrier protein] reductase